ncbi:unnamed protein product [Adineta steineri]|uniref:Bridge-like lipid transfer protein family member 1 middle region domain-containing protein n=1 Tax=Adineta steineri TaxID=433720 RepID=A0A814Q9Y8_9BILA|nr:unnamed protein product [Adineta steineri]CAF1115917.1 unnamed protein product [Adineta steineri]
MGYNTTPQPSLPSSSWISLDVCLLQIGLAEDNVQLTKLRTPVDIFTMSLYALSSGVFKIQSITGQFRRFENDFSSIENVNIHAIQSQRCRLQFRLPNDIQTHLPLGNNKKNVGFVMNEFGLQRLCFKLINNAAKQQQQRIQILPVMIQIDETQTTRASSKHKSKRKQSTDVRRPLAVVRAPTMIDRVQRLVEHEFVTAHPPIRARTTGQNVRSNIKNKYTTIAMNNDNNDLSGEDGRRTSSFLADAMQRFEPTVNVNNTNGYKRLSVGHDESDFEVNTSVLDIIVGKSQALTSLQIRGINLTLSSVINIGTIAMDVPLKPQEVHDLVNHTDNELINTSLNDTIEEPTTPIPLEQTITRKRLGTRRRDTINRNINPRPLETQQNLSTSSKRPIFEAHITAHCQGMTFSTTLLSTLKAQYKIGVLFHFGATKHTRLLSSSTVPIMRIGSTDTENEEYNDEPEKD